MWNEEHSREFIDYGHYFVPQREAQLDIVCRLIPPGDEAFHVLELCCGEGLLAEAILERFPNCTLHGYDGSPEMLKQAFSRLDRFGRRFVPGQFDLVAADWRRPAFAVRAVVSMLCIHHLDGQQKKELFRDIGAMLSPSGVFLIADLVEPASSLAKKLAAEDWDEAVKGRAQAQDGDESAFEYFQKRQWNIYHYPDPFDKPSPLADQLRWLEEAEFTGVDVYWMAAGHAIFGGQSPAG